MIAIVANVLNSDVFKSEGSKSSTNSLRLDFSSREKLLFNVFNNEKIMLSEIFAVLGQTLSIYSFILIIRILLTWFPGIDWSNGVLSALTSITDPYLNIVRGIIPPIGGFDISSLLAFLLLNVIQNLITNLQYASLGYN